MLPMYYVLLDVSCTGVSMDSLDVKSLESPSIVTYWVSFTDLSARYKRLALLVIDEQGNIIKNVLGLNTQISAYELDLLSFLALSGDNWIPCPSIKNIRRRIVEIYGSEDLFKRKLQLYPSYSLISPIIG